MKGSVIVAPLNWGLGHATRCIPIIHSLLKENFIPIIASDGEAFELLGKEFPDVKKYQLPGYNINYQHQGHLLWQLTKQMPKIWQKVKQEKRAIDAIVEKEHPVGIISDNRFGVYHPDVPSVYITHQLNIRAGFFKQLATGIHSKIMKNFVEVWIPDMAHQDNLSGMLSQNRKAHKQQRFIGPLSRLKYAETPKSIDILIILSGPEPQRSVLESKMMASKRNEDQKIVLVRGVVEKVQDIKQDGNLTSYNFVLGKELEALINKSKLIVARSGYSTIMDLCQTQSKAFFIPTPGQAEQQYLAQRLSDKKIAPHCQQNDFDFSKLNQASKYLGFKNFCNLNNPIDFNIFI